MLTRLLFVVAVLVGANSCFSTQAPNRSDVPTIVAFGDSITLGEEVGASENYPAQLSRRLGIPIINAGVWGEMSDEGLERFRKDVLSSPFDVLILLHGGNDMLAGRPAELVKSNLKEIVREAQRHHAEVIVVGVPQLQKGGAIIPELYVRLAEETGSLFEKEILLKLFSDPQYRVESIHLNAQGYELLARTLEPLVLQALHKREMRFRKDSRTR